MGTLPDVALRDADRYADDEGRHAARDQLIDELVDGMLADVDEVEDLIRYSESAVLARALSEMVVRLAHTLRGQLPADISATWAVTEGYLRVIAREEAECRLRDGDVP